MILDCKAEAFRTISFTAHAMQLATSKPGRLISE
jgi:hypothetical protein